jgi:hypothetical protein
MSLDPIYGARMPDWPSAYVLGSYDTRITFFSQQARGLNLACALADSTALAGKTRFAVVGAGAAGLAVAAGLSLLLPDAQVDIYEREEHPLHLQRGCYQRNLHPHIYEWPRKGALEPRADLPILDWEAGSAHAVATQVLRGFMTLQAYRHGRLNLRLLREVTAIERVGASDYRVKHQDIGAADPSSANYGAVFLTIGFGRERELADAPWHSYWADSGVPQAPKYAQGVTRILVTGGGDGGLIDLCAAALQDFDHTKLIELVTGWPGIDRLAADLMEIDREAGQAGRGFDFMAAYDRKVGPALREDGLIDLVAERLRRRVQLVFNTERAQPLEQPTSTLNRLLVYLLFRAAARAGSPIEHAVGKISSKGASAGVYEVDGFGRVEVDELFVRHGAATKEAFAPFEDIRMAYEAEHKRWLSADPARSAPPRLDDEARRTLERALEVSDMPVPRRLHGEAIAQQPRRARFGLGDANGSVVWAGDLGPEELISWWGEPDRALHLECAASPAEIGELACALARFAIHARQVRLESNDPRWTAWLSGLTQRSPHAHALHPPLIRPVTPVQMNATVIDPAEVGGRFHAAMDLWTLGEVDRHLVEYLAAGVEPANWVTWRIEPELRATMGRRWTNWRERLRTEPRLLARLLRLAACTVEDDQGDVADRQVLAGPYRVPSIIRTLVIALAAAEAWPVSAPRGEIPGQFRPAGRDGARARHYPCLRRGPN